MSLASRLILLTLLVAVPIFVIQVARELRLREGRVTETLHNAEAFSRLTAARQDRLVEGARVLLTAASRLEAVRARDPVRCQQELARVVAAFPQFAGIAAFATSGDTHCSSNPASPRANIASRPYFQDTMKTKQFQASGYVVGQQTGGGTVAFSFPALAENGGVEAVMLAPLSSAALSTSLNDPEIPEGAFVALIDDAGIIAARWPDPQAWVGKDVRETDWGKALHEGPDAMVSSIAGQDFVVGFTRLRPPAPLTLAMGLPLTPALQQAERQFVSDISLTVVVFVLAALAAIFAARHWIARPVRELQQTADAMAGGDLHARPPALSSIPELRILGDHFGSMARALETRMQQKDILLREVNHRVRNSLQLVTSLVALHRAGIRDPHVREQFDEIGAKIATVARVHQRLYMDEHVDSLSFGTFLEEMSQELDTALGDAAGRRVRCQAMDCRLPTDLAIPLALIVNELVTNAFKYAYPAGQAGEVRIACTRADDAVVVSVADDGTLPADFKLANHPGLGMKMIAGLLTQLRGTLTVERSGDGKAFIVRVPVRAVA